MCVYGPFLYEEAGLLGHGKQAAAGPLAAPLRSGATQRICTYIYIYI